MDNEIVGNEAETTTANDDVANTTDTTPAETQNETVEKMFNQAQVNEFVSGRLNKFYTRYGVKDSKELDELISKAQSYDAYCELNNDLNKQLNDLQIELNELKQEKMFNTNNIDPERIGDIRALFKGKELELNEENLLNELKTHAEWLKQQPKVATISVMGSNDGEKQLPEKNARSVASDLFGYDLN